MIVCQESGFYFVHIPKNGGSSIRDQIQHLDDTKGQFLGTKEHPVLGVYDSSHVPLPWLAAHFPDWYEKISGLDGYCLVRHPVERFSSSLAQRFRQHRNQSPTEVAAAEVVAEIDTIIEELETCDRFPKSTFSHFMRQAEFVFLDDKQVVQNAFRLEDINLLIGELAARSGETLATDFHSNKSFELRYRWTRAPLTMSKDVVKKYLPAKLADKLRRSAVSLLAKPGVTVFHTVLEDSPDIRSFIERYYVRDFELFESVPAGRGRFV